LSPEAKYPAAVIDLKDALRWMKNNAEKYKLNINQIAVLGTSAGAQLATLVGVTPNSELYKEENESISSEVQAIVNIDGIVSFIHPEASAEGKVAELWLDGSRDENPKNWKEASPLEYVDKNTPPILFINSSRPRFHAGRDDMIKILNKNNIYSEVHTLKDSPHSFWLLQPWFQPTLAYTVSFLNKIFKE
jgi:acetyl esterase/lipase